MSQWELSDVKEDSTFDLVVEVRFKNVLKPTDLAEVMRIFLKTTTDEPLAFLFEGIVSFSLDQQSLLITFNYYSSKTHSTDREESVGRENTSERKVQAIWCLFAKIDVVYPLDDTPFPLGFREFLSD